MRAEAHGQVEQHKHKLKDGGLKDLVALKAQQEVGKPAAAALATRGLPPGRRERRRCPLSRAEPPPLQRGPGGCDCGGSF